MFGIAFLQLFVNMIFCCRRPKFIENPINTQQNIGLLQTPTQKTAASSVNNK